MSFLPPLLPPADPEEALSAAVLATDWWRLKDGADGQIEWMHFVVVQEGLRLLVNFSVRAERGRLRMRVLTMLYADGAWTGDIDTFEPDEVSLRAGRIDAFFGEGSVRFVDGAYHLHLAPRRLPLRADLVLRPLSAPLLATNLRLPASGRFHWVSLPRLRVERATVSGLPGRSLEGALAYHDHNWGSFDFGGDFSWEWLFGLPLSDDDPWSVMALRISDRARHHTLVAGVAVWRDGRLFRDFRNAEVRVTRQGRWHQPVVHRVPADLDRLREVAGSVPRATTWNATAGSDALTIEVETRGYAQILIPGDRGVVALSEIVTRLTVTGCLQSRSISAELFGLMEVVDG